MDNNIMPRFLGKATPAAKHKVLEMMLTPHMSSVFSAAKSVEHEVAALNALKMLGYLT